MIILVDDLLDVPSEVIDVLLKAAHATLLKEGLRTKDIEVSLSFVNVEDIKRLNREFRNKDVQTDVLSFPQFETKEEVPLEGHITLGDIVVCTEVAKEQAVFYGHSFKREITYLFVHSMLHLLGYDHMESTEKKHMRQIEEDIMEKINVKRQ